MNLPNRFGVGRRVEADHPSPIQGSIGFQKPDIVHVETPGLGILPRLKVFDRCRFRKGPLHDNGLTARRRDIRRCRGVEIMAGPDSRRHNRHLASDFAHGLRIRRQKDTDGAGTIQFQVSATVGYAIQFHTGLTLGGKLPVTLQGHRRIEYTLTDHMFHFILPRRNAGRCRLLVHVPSH